VAEYMAALLERYGLSELVTTDRALRACSGGAKFLGSPKDLAMGTQDSQLVVGLEAYVGFTFWRASDRDSIPTRNLLVTPFDLNGLISSVIIKDATNSKNYAI
jgi:hypothetical protein